MIYLMNQQNLFTFDSIIEYSIIANTKFIKSTERATQRFVSDAFSILSQPFEPLQNSLANLRI